MNTTETSHPLYIAALKADQRYSCVINVQFPGKDRWTLTKDESDHPEVDSAYRAKVKADAAWLAFMRGEQPVSHGMTLAESKAHLQSRQSYGACGLSWDEIERKQGGKLCR
jgi:hypothetical protein